MKKVIYFFQVFITSCAVLILLPAFIHAQKVTPHDSTYYITYPDKLMVRVYMSQKFSSFKIPAEDEARDIEYRANSKLNVGVGATYNNLTLNVSYGFGSSDNDKKGKTKGIDFQFHLTPYKWVIDALASFHKGNYLHPKGFASTDPNRYYQRPDVKMSLAGLAAYRVPNAQKFSYRAALVQNEWQIKSAGSLLFGGEIYYGSIKGDSALIPANFDNGFSQAGIDRINFISVGPGIGYAYTLVIEKYFFITGSVIGNLDLNFSSEEKGNDQQKNTAVCPSAIYKGAIGYNSNTWSLSANLTGNLLQVNGASASKNYMYNTGNFRIMLAKKINYKVR